MTNDYSIGFLSRHGMQVSEQDLEILLLHLKIIVLKNYMLLCHIFMIKVLF